MAERMRSVSKYRHRVLNPKGRKIMYGDHNKKS